MSLPKYREYKASGLSWADELPAHWSTASLKWLCKRYSGGTPDKARMEFWENGTIPWLNSGAVNDGRIYEASAYITHKAFESSSAKWIPPGALLMALAGQGKTKGMVAQLMFESTCNQSMAAIVPTTRIDARYLYWWLTCNYQNIRNMAGGDLRDGLNLDLLGAIPCPLPLADEQTAIATFLDRETAKIDTLIAEQEKLIGLLAEKRQATISHTVTKGLNPNALLKNSGVAWLGDVPAHWNIKKLRYLLKRNGLIRGPFGGDLKKEIFVDKGIKVYEQKNAIYKSFQLGDSYITAGKFSEMTRFSVAAGDYIMSCSGTIGKVYRIPHGAPPGIINQALLILRFQDCLVEGYIDWLLIADFFLSQIIDNSQGGAMKNLVGMDVFTSISLPLPPPKEQYDIANHLNAEIKNLDKLVAEAEHGIALLQERRSALIAAAVTGQIDVRGAVSKAGVYSLGGIAA